MMAVLVRGSGILLPVWLLREAFPNWIVISHHASSKKKNTILEGITSLSRNESSRGSLKINEDKDGSSTLSSNNVYTEGHERRLETQPGRRALPLGGSSLVPVASALATIRDTWNLSKAVRPSTRCPVPFARKLSYSSTIDSARTDRECRRRNARGLSSEDNSSTKKQSESDCSDKVQGCSKDQLSDCPPSDLALADPKPSGPCTTSVDDPCCTPCAPEVVEPEPSKYCSPCLSCPDIDTSNERLWKYLVLFVAFPVLLIVSALTFSNVNRKRKQPRQEFVDVPYLRRIVKPFPWGDGKHTLFHNPVKNPISPHGYEVPDPYAVKTGEEKED